MAQEVTIHSWDEPDPVVLAEAALQNLPGAMPDIVCVGDTIDTDMQEGFLR
jgi:ribonucleotide monophosphatase NagD (HAD superfamily)